MAEYDGPMFPTGGVAKERTMFQGEADISKGLAKNGAIRIKLSAQGKYEMVDAAADALDKYLGWIVPFNKKRAKRSKPGMTPPPAPPEANYSGKVYVDPRILDGARAYANAARDMLRKGYSIHEVSGESLPDGIGCEEDANVYLNRNLRKAEKAVVTSHEGLAKYVSSLTGIDHCDLDDVVRQFENPMALAYDRDEKDVLETFARRAMQALQN